MTAYKPSGWTACDPGDYSDYNGRSIVILDDWKRVAVVIGDGSRSKTDARLIASAPDLLDAIVRLRACYSTSHSQATRKSCWDQATAAIAKATGATQ